MTIDDEMDAIYEAAKKYAAEFAPTKELVEASMAGMILLSAIELIASGACGDAQALAIRVRTAFDIASGDLADSAQGEQLAEQLAQFVTREGH